LRDKRLEFRAVDFGLLDPGCQPTASEPRQAETLPVAVYSFAGEFQAQWNLICAGVAISIAPILAFFLFAQKQLIRGFTGGVKG